MSDLSSLPPWEVYPLVVETSEELARPDSLEPFPLETLIAEAVELHTTLGQQRTTPRARRAGACVPRQLSPHSNRGGRPDDGPGRGDATRCVRVEGPAGGA